MNQPDLTEKVNLLIGITACNRLLYSKALLTSLQTFKELYVLGMLKQRVGERGKREQPKRNDSWTLERPFVAYTGPHFYPGPTIAQLKVVDGTLS